VTGEEIASRVEQALRAAASSERAEREKQYLKSDLHDFGVSVPATRRIAAARESRTWALVDGLAASVVGPLSERCPELWRTLDRWASDDDFWVRRATLLAHLLALRRGEGDFERFGRYADAMLEEDEFFIRKAIGWVLRDTARKRPALVYAWLEPRARRASGVTIREAVKYLSDRQRQALEAARAGRSTEPKRGA